VGSRVVIRYRLAPTEHGPHGESLTDALGELVSWAQDSLTVLRKDGETVVIPAALVVAAKVIPPAPPRRAAGSGSHPERGPDQGLSQ